MEELIHKIHRQAKALGACDKFTGQETLEELITLFKSPQGLEFCINSGCPSRSTFRRFKGARLERYGIYIDAGRITLNDPEQVILIGKTTATINVYRSELTQVALLRGAKADIQARRWAVVNTEADKDSHIIATTYDNAIIL